MPPGIQEPCWLQRVFGLRLLLVVSALCIFISLAAAAERDPFSFFFETWQTENGLPQNHGTAIVQTPDGYLWFGTYNGLVRFDGVRFTIFNMANSPGLVSSRITSLHPDSDGALWLGHDAGELTRFRGGHFERVTLGGPSPGRGVIAIAKDARSDLWLLHDNGLLFRARGGATIPPAPGLAAPSLVRDATGTLWRTHGGRIQIVGETNAPARRLAPPACADRCAFAQGDKQLICFAGSRGVSNDPRQLGNPKTDRQHLHCCFAIRWFWRTRRFANSM